MPYQNISLIPPSILLVDDEASFVATLAKRIAKRDLKVDTALSGEEALDKLEEGGASTTDVVILDVKMPGMDGLQTLEAIKHRHPNVEVIMLTGHATVENAIEGMKGGAYDYLMKPLRHGPADAQDRQRGAQEKGTRGKDTGSQGPDDRP